MPRRVLLLWASFRRRRSAGAPAGAAVVAAIRPRSGVPDQGRYGDGGAVSLGHDKLEVPVLCDHETPQRQERTSSSWMFFMLVYIFGKNTNTNVIINYPLSPANAPVYTNGGKTVVINMKGWKWSDGETVDAQSTWSSS